MGIITINHEKAISFSSKRLTQPNSSTTKSGFTIVELLVVIVVIGILAAITIVSYSGITQRATVASLQTDLANSSKKLKMYYALYGSYPTALDGTTKCVTLPTPDTNYCFKPSSTHTSIYSGTATTFTLTETSANGTTYTISDNSSPQAVVSLATTDPANWIQVGTQVWAKANLNVGTMVTGVTTQTNNGGTNTVEKYCYSDSESNCTTYGGLYQWDEAMKYSTVEGSQGICPAGSHIPSDNDWKILEIQLGMSQAQADATGWRGTDQGTKLKPTGASGLNMPLAGFRDTDGSFGNLSSSAYLWSSSESGSTAWYRYLYSGYANVFRNARVKAIGFSVRCLGN